MPKHKMGDAPITYPTVAVAPTQAECLVICNHCRKSEWVLYRLPLVVPCHKCRRRMRLATEPEKAHALSQVIG